MIYFSHSKQLYNTQEEKDILDFIQYCFPDQEIFNPHDFHPEQKGMEPYLEKLRQCKLTIVREYQDHIGRGVFEEIRNTFNEGKSVYCVKNTEKGYTFVKVMHIVVSNQKDWKITYGKIAQVEPIQINGE